MIITVKHLEMLRRLETEALPKMDDLTEEDLEILLHLRLEGLVTEEEDSFSLTRSGLLILESLNQAEKERGLSFEDLYEEYRLIGSRIITMLLTCERAQGRTDFDQDINKELEERGLAKGGHLEPWAQAILEAYRTAEIEFFITPSLAQSILSLPPGPARKSFLEPVPTNHIFELEAQRLLTFSLPEGQYYALTGVGSQFWAALRTGLVPEISVSTSTLRDILAGERTEALERLGAIDASGQLTQPGKHLLMAAKLFFNPIVVNPTLDLNGWDLAVLRSVASSMDLTPKGIEDFMLTMDMQDSVRFRQSLYRMEGFRLIECLPDGTYRLTPWGEELLRVPELSPVYASAVLPLTMVRTEIMGPDDVWIKKAEEQGVIGTNGYPSQKGRLVAEIASSIDRLPVITKEEMRVLRGLPLWRGVNEEEILSAYPENEHHSIQTALRKLLASGLIDLLPGNLYVLTKAGEKIKQGLSAVPGGVEFPVTPHVWRLLLILREIGRFSPQGRKIRVRKEDYDKLEEKIRLAPEDIAAALEVARFCRFVSGLDVLETGVNLLEGLDLLKELKTEWEEIRIYA
ncbi:MAG: DUF505 domain-containing protein [Thermodesulfobacteria bacterium]|nr:DUF505 domain-containing protein [Thermodesulfobacteriota bacterium]